MRDSNQLPVSVPWRFLLFCAFSARRSNEIMIILFKANTSIHYIYTESRKKFDVSTVFLFLQRLIKEMHPLRFSPYGFITTETSVSLQYFCGVVFSEHLRPRFVAIREVRYVCWFFVIVGHTDPVVDWDISWATAVPDFKSVWRWSWYSNALTSGLIELVMALCTRCRF